MAAWPMKLNTGTVPSFTPPACRRRLLLALAEVNRAAVNARRRAGLQAAPGQLNSLRRALSDTAGGSPPGQRSNCSGHVDLAVEGTSGRQHHGARRKRMPTCVTAPTTRSPSTIKSSRPLEQPQVGLVLQHAADGGFVEDAVGRARSAHGRALSC